MDVRKQIRIPVQRAVAILFCISVISHSSHLRPGSWLPVSLSKINRLATITECRNIWKEAGITSAVTSHILVYCPAMEIEVAGAETSVHRYKWFSLLCRVLSHPQGQSKALFDLALKQARSVHWGPTNMETLTKSICLGFMVTDMPNLDTNLVFQQVCWWLSSELKFNHKTIAASPDTERQGRSLKKTVCLANNWRMLNCV